MMTYSTEVLRGRRRSPGIWRWSFYLAALASVFTMVQIWAVIVLLTTARLVGPADTAVTVAMVGAGIGVLCGWGLVVWLDRQHG